jgi:phosphatidylglycerol---prolipoprotein diacylglyceryl transferase
VYAVQPEIHIFGLTLQTFGLMMGLGFVVAGLCCSRHFQELGKPADWAYEMVFASLVGGLVGARLWWIGENWSDAKDDLLGSLFSGTGLVWYGGAIGGAVAVILWAWRRRFLTATMFDVAAVPLAAGYAIGRIGCQLSGDGDYGIPWDGPWAMAYPHGTVPTTTPVHPTPVYETFTMLIVAWWLWRHRHAWRPGTLFAAYLVLAGLERFLVEFIRRNDEVFAGLTQPQLLSLAMMIGGGAWLLLLRRAPAATSGARGPAARRRAAPSGGGRRAR